MMNSEKVLESIKQAKEKLKAEDRTAEAEYQRRLDICKQCDYLHEGTCDKCGCYVELRAAMIKSDCPYHYWKQ